MQYRGTIILTRTNALLVVLLSCLLSSCMEVKEETPTAITTIEAVAEEDEPRTESTIPAEFHSKLRPNTTIQLGKVYKDTVNYVQFEDNSDDWFFVVEKNEDTIHVIYNTELKDQLVTGDKIAIHWKMDSLRPAGDPEYLIFRESLVGYDLLSSFRLADKGVKALWRETQYDSVDKLDVNTMVLNDNYLKTISEPEKAALAYVATFIGNDCEWDGLANDSRSNLKCKLVWELGLGYQCSNIHLEFLKKWFSKNTSALESLENCPTVPNTTTVQSMFQDISIQTDAAYQTITVQSKVALHNRSEASVLSYTQTDTFQFESGGLTLVDSKKNKNPLTYLKKSFTISCGTSCWMTYTEHEVISNVDTNQVTFKIAPFNNNFSDEARFETYVFSCDAETESMDIYLIENDTISDEALHPNLKRELMSYKSRFCKTSKSE